MGEVIPIDESYNQWNVELSTCRSSLERADLATTDLIKDAEGFRGVITRLQSENHSNSLTFQSLGSLHPIIPHFKTFTLYFVDSLNEPVDTSFTWGVLSVMIELAVEVNGAVYQVAQMLKEVGYDLEMFNEYRKGITPNAESFRELSIDVNVEIIKFFSAGVKIFRNGPFRDYQNELWDPLTRQYENTKRIIRTSFDRIDRLARLTRSRAHMDELAQLQSLLSVKAEDTSQGARLPCWKLPAAKNPKFYDRTNVFASLDQLLSNTSAGTEIASVALYGLGGVGKSHIALQYAHGKLKEYEVVLWLHAETSVTLAQSFSKAVVELQLPSVQLTNHAENRVLLLSWLQRSSSKFLLIFDNAEDQKLIREYWPIGGHGSILITTRNHSFAFEPAAAGIEISTFATQEGSGLLLHLLNRPQDSGGEDSALQLSKRLSGHALAIYQMAGLIQSRSWSIADFVKMYDMNAKRIHQFKHEGISLGTVWQLSFDSLRAETASLLGVLSFLEPDSIPQELFESEELKKTSKGISYFDDEWNFSEVLEKLLNLALIKRNTDTRAFSLHRLVQTEYRHHLKPEDLQKSFDDSAIMLQKAFPTPKPGEFLFTVWPKCAEYLQHVLNLVDLYKKYYAEVAKFHPIIEFCQLLGQTGRYLCEICSFEVLTSIQDTAFHTLELCKKDPGYDSSYERVANNAGLMCRFTGDFTNAKQYFEVCHEICKRILPEGDGGFGQIYNHLGNATMSAGKSEEALGWYEKSCDIVCGNGKYTPEANAIAQLNIARAYYQLENAFDGDKRMSIAMECLSGRDVYWAHLAHAYLVIGNTQRKKSDFTAAQESYERSRHYMVDVGNARVHQRTGAPTYKLGAIALDLGNVDVAIKWLREALVISDFNKVAGGDRARVLHKLSEALSRSKTQEMEAQERKLEAISLRRTIQKSAFKELDDSEEAYDMLVDTIVR